MNSKLSQMMGLAAVAVSLLGLAASASAGVVVISDSFTLNETDRTVGADLRGTTTEVGNRTWIPAGPAGETNSPVFATGDIVTGPAAGAYTTLVSLSGISSTYTSLQADINPTGGSWAALTFNYSSDSMWYPSLLLILDNGGGYTLFNSSISPIVGGTATVFTPNAFNNVQLSYYAPSNSVNISINGVGVVNNLGLGAYTPPSLNYAGFDFYSGEGKAVDNFQVAIPEPVTASLLLLGLGGLLARRRNRA
jgi:hypothetical protein